VKRRSSIEKTEIKTEKSISCSYTTRGQCLNTSNLERQGAWQSAVYLLFKHHTEGWSLGEERWASRSTYLLCSPTGAGTNSPYTSSVAVTGARPKETDRRKGSRAASLPTEITHPRMPVEQK